MEERVSLLAQQVTNMMADVTTLQSELAESGAQFAELMVRLVTNDPRIKRIDSSIHREEDGAVRFDDLIEKLKE